MMESIGGLLYTPSGKTDKTGSDEDSEEAGTTAPTPGTIKERDEHGNILTDEEIEGVTAKNKFGLPSFLKSLRSSCQFGWGLDFS